MKHQDITSYGIDLYFGLDIERITDFLYTRAHFTNKDLL